MIGKEIKEFPESIIAFILFVIINSSLNERL